MYKVSGNISDRKKMNRLSEEKSAYLKHAAHQKIDWYPWSEDAFDRARLEDKPVFLSSGAIWCHWCHVMAKECFENEEIIKLLNENFINIKLDRDERPDIDRRYQQAVVAMGSGSGWPLSVFLTSDKKPFLGGTYFPPVDSYGRPGFKKVLRAVADFYRTKRQDVYEYSEKLINLLNPDPLLAGEVNESLINEAVKNILSECDIQNGGFGAAPKFPMAGAMEFLINRYFFTNSEPIGHAIKKTLESMAKGGVYDQLGGGFHRYSTDEAWVIPHFEKMADDNAWLLRNYIYAYSVFGDEYFREIASGIINFLKNVLSDPEGGFYASQDADVTPEDEGGYFTWTDEDFRNILDEEEHRVLTLHLFNDNGSMHHDKSKKVLFIAMEAEIVADKAGIEVEKVFEIIKRGKEKLLKARNRRETPFIDRTLYTSLNGLLIASYLKAYRILKDKYLKDFSLKSLERLLKSHFIGNELFHSEGVSAVLDDYIYLIDALIAAYEVTADSSYLDRADGLMELCIKKFLDKNGGGFFDTDAEVLGLRLKAIEDIPHPSANSTGILLLLKLYYLTGKEIYHQYAEEALKGFFKNAEDMGIQAGYYFCAVDAYFNSIKLTLETTPSSKLAETALSLYVPYSSISYGEDNGRVIPCLKDICGEAIRSPDKLKDFLRHHP
ncbi:MAG: thioredoxin domain-containing protein [Thermodesulfovibrionales bacterium]